MLPPATPSPLPVGKIARLGIICPAGPQTQSLDGRPVTVRFAAPVVNGGQQPVTVGCSPHSGSAFGIGSTDVTCGASDALLQTASCVFQVTILGPPRLAATRFLAFGDSLTAGVVSPHGGGRRLDRARGYPSVLQRELASRYVTEEIRVVNAGAPGEEASGAVGRFHAELARHRPQVVLLMEGTNDLDVIAGAGPEGAAAALDRMAAAARAARLDMLLMTVPPQRGTGGSARVSSLNGRIRSIASRSGATLVDVHHLLLAGACTGPPPIPCIGGDGIHPTAEGYRLIAEELERVLVARYDVEILPEAEPAGDAPEMVFPAGSELQSHRRP